MVMRAGVESRRNRELEQRALPGVFGRNKIIDTGLMQGDSVGLTVMQDNPFDRHLGLQFAKGRKYANS
jgi:hypothetical protein